MKSNFTLLVIFLLISNFFFSQEKIKKKEILGNWIKVKTEMKDGSKLIPIFPKFTSHFEMIFQSKRFIKNINLAQERKKTGLEYKLKNSQIITSKHFCYNVERVTKDSLIICEEMPKVEDFKLKRYYLVKKEVLLNQYKDLNKGKKELIANPFFTPKFKGNITSYLNDRLLKRHTDLKLKGQIAISLNKKKITTKITYRDSGILLMQENILVKALNNSYSLWNLDDFKNFDSILIDFVIIMEKKNRGFSGLKVGLLTDSFEQLLGTYGLPYKQRSDGKKYLSLGLQSIENKDYKKAIEHFTKSYQSDRTLVESLYNRAYCYYVLKQYEKACFDWYSLKNLGQKDAEKLFSKNCKIIK